MAKSRIHPSNTPTNTNRMPSAGQLADLAALLGLMQSASKISQDLDALANEVGGSLERITERFGVPFWDVHNTYVQQIGAPKRGRKAAKGREVLKVRKARRRSEGCRPGRCPTWCRPASSECKRPMQAR